MNNETCSNAAASVLTAQQCHDVLHTQEDLRSGDEAPGTTNSL
jgi:hypothetical protein